MKTLPLVDFLFVLDDNDGWRSVDAASAAQV